MPELRVNPVPLPAGAGEGVLDLPVPGRRRHAGGDAERGAELRGGSSPGKVADCLGRFEMKYRRPRVKRSFRLGPDSWRVFKLSAAGKKVRTLDDVKKRWEV